MFPILQDWSGRDTVTPHPEPKRRGSRVSLTLVGPFACIGRTFEYYTVMWLIWNSILITRKLGLSPGPVGLGNTIVDLSSIEHIEKPEGPRSEKNRSRLISRFQDWSFFFERT